ncbi:wings apart-like protein homolog isoform X2 [Mizuhopecten yessoensis]|uniref:Wings apart-like protein-like n=1 Tax=Mizuhopecten yessoensis TaxID=6573 RepID=A0A210R2M8_MIZYE|nr:wings apart-like protein homolog isoform X2 [Mizuhopecten yessoensis]OWF55247.1 Wings apart-like protein-like [Mizuhopecten yessoensis]
MASKYAVKTYSRSYGRETAASKAFDEIVTNKSGAQNMPIKTANTKWGKTQFSRVRDEDPFQTTCKKVKSEVETEDPFSFGSDESETARQKMVKEEPPTSSHAAGLGRPAIPNMKVIKSHSYTPEKNKNEPEARNLDSQPTFKRPVRTYSRAAKKQNVDNTKQLSIDQFAKPVSNDEDDDMPVLEPEGSAAADPYASHSSSYAVIESSDDSEEKPDPYSQYDEDEEEEGAPHLLNEQRLTYSRHSKMAAFSGIVSSSPKTHLLQSDDEENPKATVLNFRSHFMDPAVYSRFNYVPRPEDPVGRLNNSKVLQKSEIKHGKGSTLIVICSPKPPTGESKTKLYHQKTVREPYSRDNAETTADDLQNSGNDSQELCKVEESGTDTSNFEFSEESSASTPSLEEHTSATNENDNPVKIQYSSRKGVKRGRDTSDKSVRYNKFFRSRNSAAMNEENDSKKISSSPEEQQTGLDDNNQENDHEQNTAPKEHPVHVKANKKKQDISTSFGFDEDGESQPSLESSEKSEGDPSAPQSMEVGEDAEQTMQQSEGSQSEEEEMDSSQNTQELSQTSADSQEAEPPKLTKAKTVRVREKKIFKSKNKGDVQKKMLQSPKKSPSKAVYNVRSWQEDFDEEERNKNKDDASGPPKLVPIPKMAPKFEEPGERPNEPPKLSRAVHWPDRLGDEAYTSVHVSKEHKELFTVVKNVKQAHECQEYGETQEFSDDVEYLLAGLQEGQPMSTRCLSCTGLAQKCILPAFRMHLRAHGTVAKIFCSLQDACTDPSLALCTALLMFMLSRDRLNMDLDGESLDLMLKLLGVDNQEQLSATITASGKRALNRNRDRVGAVYEQLQQECGTKLPDLESISTGNLAMESLLSLTSRRAGEWFKEELRTLGALDHIVDTVCSCIEAVGDDTTLLTDSTIENFKKIDRCLRVLENVTFVNTENQTYLISYKQGVLVQSICRALKTCEQCLPVYPLVESEKIEKDSTGYVVYSCVLAILRVLLNLTHDNEFGSTKTGEQTDFINVVLTCILQTPQHVPVDMRFDILVLSLGLMINLVEHCEVNRRRLIDAKTESPYEFEKHQKDLLPAAKALVQVFCHRYEIAKKMEEQDFGEPTTPQASPNKSGEWKESDSGIEWVINSAKKAKEAEREERANDDDTPLKEKLKQNEEDGKNANIDDEETFTKALHRAGKHMENSIVASYVALLLGCVIQDNTMFVDNIKVFLPKGNFDDMITILKKFLGFMNLTTAIGSTGGKSIAHVIEVLEGC